MKKQQEIQQQEYAKKEQDKQETEQQNNNEQNNQDALTQQNEEIQQQIQQDNNQNDDQDIQQQEQKPTENKIDNQNKNITKQEQNTDNNQKQIIFNKDLRVLNLYDQKIKFLQHNNYDILALLFNFNGKQLPKQIIELQGIYYFINVITKHIIKIYCDCNKQFQNGEFVVDVKKLTQKDKIVDLWISKQCKGYTFINLFIEDLINIDKNNLSEDEEQIQKYISQYKVEDMDTQSITDTADIKFIEIGQDVQERDLTSISQLNNQNGYLIPLTNNLCFSWLGTQTNQTQQKIYNEFSQKYNSIEQQPKQEQLSFKLLFKDYLQDAKLIKQQEQKQETKQQKTIQYQYQLDFKKPQQKQENLVKFALQYHIFNSFDILPQQAQQITVEENGQNLNVIELASHQCHYFQFYDQQTQTFIIFLWVGYLSLPKQAFYFQGDQLLNPQMKQLKQKGQVKLQIVEQFQESELFKYQFDRIVYKQSLQINQIPKDYILHDYFSVSNIQNRYEFYSIIDKQLYQTITQITHIFSKTYYQYQNENIIFYDKFEKQCYSSYNSQDTMDIIRNYNLFSNQVKYVNQLINSPIKIIQLDNIDNEFDYYSLSIYNDKVQTFNSYKPDFPPQSNSPLLAHSDNQTFILVDSKSDQIQQYLKQQYKLADNSIKLKLSIFKPFKLMMKVVPFKCSKLIKLRYILDMQLEQLRLNYWNTSAELNDIWQQQKLIKDIFQYDNQVLLKEQLEKCNLQ